MFKKLCASPECAEMRYPEQQSNLCFGAPYRTEAVRSKTRLVAYIPVGVAALPLKNRNTPTDSTATGGSHYVLVVHQS